MYAILFKREYDDQWQTLNEHEEAFDTESEAKNFLEEMEDISDYDNNTEFVIVKFVVDCEVTTKPSVKFKPYKR